MKTNIVDHFEVF